MLEAVTQEQLHRGPQQEPKSDNIIILSDKVGEIIDLEERNYYQLFLFSENFQSAVILQLPDSSLVIQITETKEGVQQQLIMQVDQKILEEFRKNIEKRDKTLEFRERAKVLAKEKWDKERWKEESRNDVRSNYRYNGTILGFALGATAGMLVGKGIQGKKVERTVYHPGAWGYDPWTEDFYSYKHKKAPRWGAAIGGISGAVCGYFLGKKADKEYYILVPKNIRMQETKSSWFGNFLFGFGVTGPFVGLMTGNMLYTPKSGKRAALVIGGVEFVMGYLPGAVIGMILIDGYKRRAKHKKLWEASLLEEKPESSLDIEFIPLDPTAFSIYPRKSPSGEIFYEYRMDLLRVRF